MQILSSPEFWGNYHANFPITGTHATNGMRTRMSALHCALKMPVITEISEGTHGDLLIEPFAVKPTPNERKKLAANGWQKTEWYAIEDRNAKEICDYDRGKKYLICSEMEVLRWRGSLREQIINTVETVFTTCDYQETLLKALGITTERLAEPINEFMFYPSTKRARTVIAIGSASHAKNVEMLIDFYKALEGKNFHRIFIGEPRVWGYVDTDKKSVYNRECYKELLTVCDEVHRASSLIEVAHHLSTSEFYVNFAYHEVGCRTALEALMSGCGILWGQHPLGNEMTALCHATNASETVTVLEGWTGRIDTAKTRNHAKQKYGFSAVANQLKEYFNET